MPDYPKYVPCAKCGLNAQIQSATTGNVVKSPNANWMYKCPAGHSFVVYGSSL
jgi:hypothetical protein